MGWLRSLDLATRSLSAARRYKRTLNSFLETSRDIVTNTLRRMGVVFSIFD